MTNKTLGLSINQLNKILKENHFSNISFQDAENEDGVFSYFFTGIHTGWAVEIEVRSFEDAFSYGNKLHEVYAKPTGGRKWKEVTPEYKPV